MVAWRSTISLGCSVSRLLTRHNQGIAQWSPDPFPRERVRSGHETTKSMDCPRIKSMDCPRWLLVWFYYSIVWKGVWFDSSRSQAFIIQFLIGCSMQKRRGKAWSILSHEWCYVYLGRQRGRGPDWKRRVWSLSGSFRPKYQSFERSCTAPVCEMQSFHPPLLLQTASDQKLDDGKAWERG